VARTRLISASCAWVIARCSISSQQARCGSSCRVGKGVALGVEQVISAVEAFAGFGDHLAVLCTSGGSVIAAAHFTVPEAVLKRRRDLEVGAISRTVGGTPAG